VPQVRPPDISTLAYWRFRVLQVTGGHAYTAGGFRVSTYGVRHQVQAAKIAYGDARCELTVAEIAALRSFGAG
jgi:hypothetical protein